jgi:hypothetical protein
LPRLIAESARQSIPPGYKTTRQFADEKGLSLRRAREIIHEYLRRGLLTMCKLPAYTETGVLRLVPHYAPVPQKSNWKAIK